MAPPGALDLGCGTHPKGKINTDIIPTGNLMSDATALPIHHGSVPAVTAFQVLSYYPDLALDILREVHRVLEPGGEFIMTVGRWQRQRWNWPLLLHHMSFVEIQKVKGIFSYKGWRCRRCNLATGRDYDDVLHKHRWIPVPRDRPGLR